MRGMDNGMDKAAASKDYKTGTDKKYPAAFGLAAGYLNAAGPECPGRNQQAYNANKNFLTVMIFKQEFF